MAPKSDPGVGSITYSTVAKSAAAFLGMPLGETGGSHENRDSRGCKKGHIDLADDNTRTPPPLDTTATACCRPVFPKLQRSHTPLDDLERMARYPAVDCKGRETGSTIWWIRLGRMGRVESSRAPSPSPSLATVPQTIPAQPQPQHGRIFCFSWASGVGRRASHRITTTTTEGRSPRGLLRCGRSSL